MVNAFSKELREHVLNGGFIHCRDIHDGTCEQEATRRFLAVFKLALKFYLPIHLVPTLIFKWKQLRTKPGSVAKHFIIAFLKSVMMLSVYCTIFRYLLCQTKNTRQKVDRINPIISGFCATFTILFEPAGRRTELALYLAPRFLEAVWNFLLRRKIVVNIRNGEVILFAIAMSIICYCYQNEEDCIKPTYLGVFKKFWGEN